VEGVFSEVQKDLGGHGRACLATLAKVVGTNSRKL
jgi:hypothetical protein